VLLLFRHSEFILPAAGVFEPGLNAAVAATVLPGRIRGTEAVGR
jgi:hypothetical protein